MSGGMLITAYSYPIFCQHSAFSNGVVRFEGERQKKISIAEFVRIQRRDRDGLIHRLLGKFTAR